MQFKHAPAAVSAAFDDPDLVSTVGLVPMLRLAQAAGLADLAQQRLSVPTDYPEDSVIPSSGREACAVAA